LLSKAARGASSFRPFDRGRDGFLTGEGGAALLFEPADAARARGAEPVGRLLGTGNTHEIDLENRIPVPRKAIGRACAIALAEAGLAPADLSLLILHGSATKRGDYNELAAASDLLGGAAGDVPLVGLKPYTGHMGAASDIGELIFGLCALRDGRLPPTPGFDQAEAGFDGLHIPKSPSSLAGESFLSISYGIGGQTSATVVGAP
jgi:3-oxoacyl-[acyl-carrier-protein] synthase II